MMKKLLAIALAAAMVFAFTGCETLDKAFDAVDKLLGGEGGQEGTNGGLDEEYNFSYITPDGELEELPDGEYYFSFETDEEGNLIGKVEIGGAEGEEDTPIQKEEANKQEETSKSTVSASGKSIISHIGLKYSDIKAMYGTDMELNEYGALYYPDGRTPLMFYFMGDEHPDNFTGNETVSCVAVKGGMYPVCSFLTGSETADEVIGKGGYRSEDGYLHVRNGSESTVIFDGNNPNGSALVAMHADDEGALFNFNYYWKNADSRNKKKADLIIIG